MSDYETTQRRRNVIVGFFVIVALAALVWLIFKFGELPTVMSKVGSYDVMVQFPMATGVERDTAIRFCGYHVGSVTKVLPPKVLKDLDTEKFYYQTLVTLSIDDDYKEIIPSDVEVHLITRGLGSNYVELMQMTFDANAPTGNFLAPGTVIQGRMGDTSEVVPEKMQKQFEELAASLKILIDNTNEIVGDPNNKANVKSTLSHLATVSEEASDTLAKAKAAIDQGVKSLKEFEAFSTTGKTMLANADAKIDTALTAMVGTSEELGKTLTEMRVTLNTVNSGKGTVGRLVNDGKLYESLLENSEQITIVLAEIKSLVEQFKEKGVGIKLK